MSRDSYSKTLLFNPLQSGIAYLYPWKHQKPGFLILLGGMDKQQWGVMGQV